MEENEVVPLKAYVIGFGPWVEIRLAAKEPEKKVSAVTFRSKKGAATEHWVADQRSWGGGYYKNTFSLKDIRIQTVAHNGGRVIGQVKAGDFESIARRNAPKRGFVIEITRELADKLVNQGG